jgi:hypothetical protein
MDAMLPNIPEWLDYLLRGIFIFLLMSCSAVILTRTGRNPYWALLAIVPFTLIIGLWFMAFSRWPRLSEKDQGAG